MTTNLACRNIGSSLLFVLDSIIFVIVRSLHTYITALKFVWYIKQEVLGKILLAAVLDKMRFCVRVYQNVDNKFSILFIILFVQHKCVAIIIMAVYKLKCFKRKFKQLWWFKIWRTDLYYETNACTCLNVSDIFRYMHKHHWLGKHGCMLRYTMTLLFLLSTWEFQYYSTA